MAKLFESCELSGAESNRFWVGWDLLRGGSREWTSTFLLRLGLVGKYPLEKLVPEMANSWLLPWFLLSVQVRVNHKVKLGGYILKIFNDNGLYILILQRSYNILF